MLDWRRLPVDHTTGPTDRRSTDLSDRLVAKAHPKNRPNAER